MGNCSSNFKSSEEHEHLTKKTQGSVLLIEETEAEKNVRRDELLERRRNELLLQLTPERYNWEIRDSKTGRLLHWSEVALLKKALLEKQGTNPVDSENICK